MERYRKVSRLSLSARTLAKRKKPPIKIRPRSDRKEKEYPALAGLLGEELQPKFCHAPIRDSILNTRITAEALENAVLNALSAILADMPNQQSRLIKAIRENHGREKGFAAALRVLNESLT